MLSFIKSIQNINPLYYDFPMNNKILVVDDDTAINELIKVNLELSGYQVVQAFDGVKGFALCKQELPSLVVLDVMMPEVDGFTVAKRIRQNDDTKDIPIIMVSIRIRKLPFPITTSRKIERHQ